MVENCEGQPLPMSIHPHCGWTACVLAVFLRAHSHGLCSGRCCRNSLAAGFRRAQATPTTPLIASCGLMASIFDMTYWSEKAPRTTGPKAFQQVNILTGRRACHFLSWHSMTTSPTSNNWNSQFWTRLNTFEQEKPSHLHTSLTHDRFVIRCKYNICTVHILYDTW